MASGCRPGWRLLSRRAVGLVGHRGKEPPAPPPPPPPPFAGGPPPPPPGVPPPPPPAPLPASRVGRPAAGQAAVGRAGGFFPGVPWAWWGRGAGGRQPGLQPLAMLLAAG